MTECEAEGGEAREEGVQGQARKTAVDQRKSTCNKVKA